MEQLQIVVAGDPPVIRLVGEVDLSNVEELRAAIQQVRDRGLPVAVELADLAFIDIGGLSLLMTQAQSLDGQGPLVVKNPSRLARKVLKLMGAEETTDLEIEPHE